MVSPGDHLWEGPLTIILLKRLLSAVVETRWWFLLAATLGHIFIGWAVLAALGETDLVGDAYLYYYLTTVTTVGYGDLSPSTEAGRLFGALWLMVGGIGLFTTVLTKIIGAVGSFWRRRLDGYGDYSDLVGATIIIGHRDGRTARLIEEMQADQGRDVPVVVVTSKEKATVPDDVRLVRTLRLTDNDSLVRAGIKHAGRVVVFADDDDLSLSACLAASSANPDVHMVAFFLDADTAGLARAHCQNLETVTANAEELVMRATTDPGSSAVLSTLVSAADNDGALFGVTAAALGAPLSVAAAQEWLRAESASLVAVAPAGAKPMLCMAGEDVIAADATVFYVARKRLA